jgi:micrococcal nuclease
MNFRTITRILLIVAVALLSLINAWQGERKAPVVSSVATSSAVSASSLMGEKGHVQRVIDGDTIELSDKTKVRYIGVDTPETTSTRPSIACFGHEATEANRTLVEGKEVRLEKDVSDTDQYGRLLRYVYIGDVLVNEKLVRDGYARAATFPPDVAKQEVFIEAQEEARTGGRGLWSACK